jgi:tripartite-type tricarboxylate transporter receptor subunit TctC
MTIRRDFLVSTGAGLIASVIGSTAMADEFPSKPIRFVVPFTAGGAADVLARQVGQSMTQRWGQQVVVEDKPGAGTVIGTSMVAKAPSDGYTILFVANSFVINRKLHKSLPYDGMNAFDPVAMMVTSPQVIAVNATSPYRTFNQWIDAAKTQPGALSIATLGPATLQHIAAEMLQRTAGIQLIYAPFPGGGPAVNAVLGNQVGAVLANLSEMSAHIEAGLLRPLAVTTRERLATLKQVPTVAESGYSNYEALAWFGVVAPVGTPRNVLAKLAEGVEGALNDPKTRKNFITGGLQPAFLDPTAFATHISSEYDRYSRVIDEAKIRLD